jgi:hypothetical protein
MCTTIDNDWQLRTIPDINDIKIAYDSPEYKKLTDMFEKVHIYDLAILQTSELGLTVEEMRNMINCIENNTEPLNDHVRFGLMKYNKEFKKEDIIKLLLRGYKCALLVFSMICHKDDKDVYRNIFFDTRIMNDNPDYCNYLHGKVLLGEELMKKSKSKEILMNGLNYLSKLPNEYVITVPYLRHHAYYHLCNYDKSLDFLVEYLSRIKFFNQDMCEIHIDKLNKLKLYIEINKMPNVELFTSIINKLKEDEKLKRFDTKINKNECVKCDQCKSIKVTVQYYECKHYYCVDCIKNKSCNLCKGKHYI